MSLVNLLLKMDLKEKRDESVRLIELKKIYEKWKKTIVKFTSVVIWFNRLKNISIDKFIKL